MSTFEVYLAEHYYTKYAFSCADLTTPTDPPMVINLPSDFLSTAFGAAVRLNIGAKFGGPAATPTTTPPVQQQLRLPSPSSASSSLLQSIFNRATATGLGYSTPSTRAGAAGAGASQALKDDDLAQNGFPWLKQRYVEKFKVSPSSVVAAAFCRATAPLVADLPASSQFPFLDVWRLVVLQ
ncbi:hypothetical protein BC826DRAFT_1183636 [Russula brevipes]|nr:hypothetical protein BC826DRAFT_1183636 [Russula brevipes]